MSSQDERSSQGERDSLAALAQAIHTAAGWLNLQPIQWWVRGKAGHLTAQIVGQGGQSLLVSLSSAVDKPRLDLVVVGNRGIMTWSGELDSANDMPLDGATSREHRSVLADWQTRLGEALKVESLPVVGAATRSSASPATGEKSSTAQFGVLLVNGAHSHQENYARSFAADPRCRLVGLTDESNLPARRQELNAQLARELEIPLLNDFAAAIRRDDVQIISICAAPERRARLIELCAATGKHIYLDKPLAASAAEADSIVQAFAGSRGCHQMFSLVHSNFAARVRRAVESGQLGELTAVHADAFFAKGMAGSADLSRVRKEQRAPTAFETIEGKRELHNVGVYSLVLLEWLTGATVRRLFANTSNYFFREHQALDMEDYAHLTLELSNGVLATVATGRTGWRSHPAGGMNRVWLIGTKRSLLVDWYQLRLEVWADEEPWQLPRRHPEDPMGFWSSTTAAAGAKPKTAWLTPAEATDDVRYFVDCIAAGRPSDVPVELAANVMRALMAAYDSAATGKAVEIE